MQGVAFFGIFHHSFDLLVFQHLVLTANFIDLHQVLIYNPSCADIQVPYFGVSHLAVRKAHILSAGH